jgi:hypothetical protein
MTITQTVEVPASRRITLEVPPQIPVGRVILTLTSAEDTAANAANDCPVCAKHRDPKTGNPRYNAETKNAIEEGIAISCGKIPAKRFSSLDEMWDDLMREDTDN